MCINVFVLPFLKISIFQKQTGGRKETARQSGPDQRQEKEKTQSKREEEGKTQARICKL
jgi:hypothetical protein